MDACVIIIYNYIILGKKTLQGIFNNIYNNYITF